MNWAECWSRRRTTEEHAKPIARLSLRMRGMSYLPCSLQAATRFNRKEYADAEASAREAVKLDTDHRFPDANHIYGVLMMMRRDYRGAAEQLRLHLKPAPRAAHAEMARGRLASCEKALKALDKQ